MQLANPPPTRQLVVVTKHLQQREDRKQRALDDTPRQQLDWGLHHRVFHKAMGHFFGRFVFSWFRSWPIKKIVFRSLRTYNFRSQIGLRRENSRSGATSASALG